MFRFWRNKVKEIINVQKTYLLEQITDQEIDRVAAKNNRLQKKRNKAGTDEVKLKRSTVNESQFKKARRSHNLRDDMSTSNIKSLFKRNAESHSKIYNTQQRNSSILETVEDRVIKTQRLSDSQITKQLLQSQPRFNESNYARRPNQPKIKSRPRQEIKLTQEHKDMIIEQNELDRITNKVLKFGLASLDPSE